ncbi:NAD(P)-dependent alcohol dehydrogenase [Sphingobium sp. H39-3-25]|nr:NAD(P)-dependent alcohol dehydrogenase [Sphingobium arseniciresistens]
MIKIAYAGICHSDLEHVHAKRGNPTFPMVPGHEIAGVVTAVGGAVTKVAVGDHAGVGNMVDSCRRCSSCLAGLEQYCSGRRVLTYNSIDHDGETTYGGYSELIVVDEAYVITIPDGMALSQAAPLFCAGITVYSPLRHWRAGPGRHVAIVGFGGLGHVGVQIAHALGARTTVLDLSPAKREDALRLGADEYVVSSEPGAIEALQGAFDLIISTVPANVDIDAFLSMLAVDGTLVTLAIPEKPLTCLAASLLANRRSIAGTRSGGIAETQEMIDFCATHGIGAEVEIIAADEIDRAYERLERGDVRYRFVIDASTIDAPAGLRAEVSA